MPKSLLGLLSLTLPCLLQGTALPPAPPVSGHLVLVIEGDARELQVTAVVAKSEPWGGTPRGLRSDYSIAVLAADGSVLGSYPLDLSHFDLDPARIGTGPRVEGCRVIDTRVTVLANVPRFRDASGLAILHGRTVVGSLAPHDWQELLRTGVKR